MATRESEAGPMLCTECKALPPVEGLATWPGMCARCGVELAPVAGGEGAIERARRGPVAIVAPYMTPEQAAVIREAEAFVDSVKPGALPSIANLCQAVATMRGGAP